MGGTILEHESKTIYNAGRKQGKMEVKQLVAKRLYKEGAKAEYIANVVDASVKLVKEWILLWAE